MFQTLSFWFINANYCRLPFDSTNPIGYLIALILEFHIPVPILIDSAFIWSSVVAYFLFTITAAKDLKCDLNKINTMAKRKQTRSQITMQLLDSVKFYSCLKRYGFLSVNFHHRLLDCISEFFFSQCTRRFLEYFSNSDYSHVFVLLNGNITWIAAYSNNDFSGNSLRYVYMKCNRKGYSSNVQWC